jgi:hypothetical protein
MKTSIQGKPSIVRAHDIWADGSCFQKVIPTQWAEGHEVMDAQYGLDTPKGDAAISHPHLERTKLWRSNSINTPDTNQRRQHQGPTRDVARWTRHIMTSLAVLAMMAVAGSAAAQKHEYPPQSAYLMARDAEVSLARSAAPAHISGRATVKVLTPNGYEVAETGDNGFVCIVMRGWADSGIYTPVAFRLLGYEARIRAPVCFTPDAVRMVLPFYDLRRSPSRIARITPPSRKRHGPRP